MHPICSYILICSNNSLVMSQENNKFGELLYNPNLISCRAYKFAVYCTSFGSNLLSKLESENWLVCDQRTHSRKSVDFADFFQSICWICALICLMYESTLQSNGSDTMVIKRPVQYASSMTSKLKLQIFKKTLFNST